jgi:PHD-finger
MLIYHDSGAALQDNDIILCDGPCNRAYHEKCLDPPLNTAELPEDAPWLCPACSTKVSQLFWLT